jgi:hypothetical protein
VKIRSLVVSALCAVLGPAVAHAEPTLYPPDLKVLSGITNTTDSNLMADELDSKTVWVLPPNTAKAQVSGLHSLTASMGFCAEMRDSIQYSRELSADMNEIAQVRKAKREDFVKLDKRATDLEIEAAHYATDRNLQALADLDTRLQQMEIRLTDLYKIAETCDKTCDEINGEISNLNKAKNAALLDRNAISRQNTDDIREYTRRLAVAKAARKAGENARAVYTDLNKEFSDLQNRMRENFAGLGKMEGGRAAITYVSSWDDNITQLRNKNPGFNFAKVATKNAKLMTELAGVKDIDPQGAVMGIALGGVMQDGVASFSQYPQSLSTNLKLSLIGACPMVHPEYFDLKSDDVASMRYGVIITYDYDSIFRVKATAKYNMYKLYQKIVSSGSSGGLFSSSSWSDVEEKNFFRDSFTVIWDDKENAVPPEAKASREAEMRHAVMWRLANLALPSAPNRGDIMAAAQPPTRGAVVISDSLMQTCPGNVYCVAGAAVFKVLDAIFGSSSANASYTSITDVEVIENYENTQKITKPWLTTYL